jgi:chromosome segregation ATPase
MTDKVQTKVYLPEQVKDRLDADTRSNTEVVETALAEHFDRRDSTAAEVRLEHKKDELEAAEETLESEREHVETLREEIKQLQQRRREAEERRDPATRELDDLIDDMLEYDTKIDADTNRVKRIAREHFAGDAAACLAAIEDRAASREDVDREVVR